MSKTILITGANRGIGLEMTRQSGKLGNKVIACTRNTVRSTELNMLSREDDNITLLELDVCDQSSMQRATLAVTDSIDILVCNAGILNSYGGLQDPNHSYAAIQKVLMTNIAGVFFTARTFLPNILNDPPGKIAIISSIMGSQKLASSNAPIYRASKAAATNLAQSMAVELAPQGVAVGAFHPGWVRTDMGGANASVSASDSATGLLKRFDCLSLDTTGIFEDFDGKRLPF